MTKIKIEVGKTYKTRSNRIVKILKERKSNLFAPFVGKFEDNAEWNTLFYEDGRTGATNSENDIVEEFNQ